jgi:conjugative relaxase-like TrwC/TraI family protein
LLLIYLLRMLAPKAQYSLKDAKRYFKEHLGVGDYYAEGQHRFGPMVRQGRGRFGIERRNNLKEFERLCENLHPQTGQKLTLRQNATRIETGNDGVGHEKANRRLFYDFTFSPPKSVSIAALVRDDARIVTAHEQAVAAALNHLQTSRQRACGKTANARTGPPATSWRRCSGTIRPAR